MIYSLYDDFCQRIFNVFQMLTIHYPAFKDIKVKSGLIGSPKSMKAFDRRMVWSNWDVCYEGRRLTELLTLH